MAVVTVLFALCGTFVAGADTAGATGASGVAASAIPVTARPSPTPVPRWTAAAAAKFWTAHRMREAKPFPDGRSLTADEAPGTSTPNAQGTARTGPGSSHFGGLPMIGRMYMQTGSGAYFCTAGVVNSPQHDIVLTAGHCMDARAGGGSFAFVPQWTAATPQPHGVFPVATDSEGRGRVWIDGRYYDRGRVRGAPWDTAFVQVGARSDGKQVQDVVGGNTLATGRGAVFPSVRLIGYPGADSQPLTCDNQTTLYTPTDGTPGSYLRIACDDFRGGTSGSPFLANFDPTSGTGDVVGDIGGWDTGGPTADVSYSPVFDSSIQNLYDAAVAGVAPARPNVLPGASTLAHATLMTSGYFTATPSPDPDKSDLITRWSDGELTLYRGAGNGRFDKEIQLAAPNSTWKKAVSLTSGDFAGANTYDLLVRWTDGSLTLFPDVDAQGLHRQIRIVSSGTLWQHEVSMTAGRYTTDDRWPDDLIVRWSDGETTLYRNISSTGPHGTVRLKAPNSTWKHAASLASADFTGTNESDLVVRWSDGSLTLYPDADQGGLHGAVRLRAASPRWTHASVTLAGDFTSTDARSDDYLVRWSDGGLSLFTDSGSSLGPERVLAAAGP